MLDGEAINCAEDGGVNASRTGCNCLGGKEWVTAAKKCDDKCVGELTRLDNGNCGCDDYPCGFDCDKDSGVVCI
jgi:hypothetical protein